MTLNRLYFSMVGLINQYFIFSSGLTVFIHHSRRLDHPGAVKGLSKRLLVHMESLCYQVGVGGGVDGAQIPPSQLNVLRHVKAAPPWLGYG